MVIHTHTLIDTKFYTIVFYNHTPSTVRLLYFNIIRLYCYFSQKLNSTKLNLILNLINRLSEPVSRIDTDFYQIPCLYSDFMTSSRIVVM